MLINGYYGNFRGSFYAADSGLNMARQQLVNKLQSYVNTSVCTAWSGTVGACAAPPMNTANAVAAVTANVLTPGSGMYSSFTSLNTGNATKSWPGSFEIANYQLANGGNCTNSFALSGPPTVQASNTQGQATAYQFVFTYQLCAIGRALSAQQAYTAESGNIIMNVLASGSEKTTVSFAAFGGFVSNYPPNFGPLVQGVYQGPSFTNGAWQFEPGSFTFTGPVGQVSPNVDYYINGTWYDSPTASYTAQGTTIAPSFQGGLNLAQAPLAMPPNDFSQQWAVLDGVGCGEGGTTCGVGTPPTPTNANLNSYLKDINGNAYPLNGTSAGVYLPYSCTGGPCAMNGGGIYVEGSAGIGLTMGTDSNGNLTQTYKITTQDGKVTTITTSVNAPASASYTTMTSGTKTVTLPGVPMNNVPTTPQQGTMLYVDGTINSLSGPGEGVASIQDHAQITIVANGTVNITGDVIYKHEPNTQDTNDTYIPANDTGQVLGVFTSNGNVNLSSPYGDNNLRVDGALAPLGQNCGSCGFTVSGYINTFNNYGGEAQTNIFGANMSWQNTYYDTRLATGLAPPWFPQTTVNQSAINLGPPTVIPSVNRVSWSTSPQ
jgi:hypothetical protein